MLQATTTLHCRSQCDVTYSHRGKRVVNLCSELSLLVEINFKLTLATVQVVLLSLVKKKACYGLGLGLLGTGTSITLPSMLLLSVVVMAL